MSELELKMSASIGKLGEALSKAQGEMEGAVKDSINPYFKNKYADLSSVMAAIREPFSKNGLSVVQLTEGDGINCGVTTILLHSSGEWVRGTITARPVKADPQGIGSCLTYLRRYSLAAIAGVCPEDDDGNEASRENKREVKQMDAHVSDIKKETSSLDEKKVKILGHLIGKDKAYGNRVLDAKKWCCEIVKTDWDKFTEKDCEEVLKVIGEKNEKKA